MQSKMKNKSLQTVPSPRTSVVKALKKDWRVNKLKFLMALPVLIWLFLFCYKPLYGIIIAFKAYSPGLGITGSPWVGFKYFIDFFQGPNFGRLLRNTLLLNFYMILFCFPIPILFALFTNEIRNRAIRSVAQSVSFFPHFISLVVICGMVTQFCSSDGLIGQMVSALAGSDKILLQEPSMFRPIYILSDIWQHTGFSSIIYFSALCGISSEIYEAADIDGASRLQKLLHVSIPGIAPTIIIMLILRVGQMMSLGADKIILLYNPLTYETADIINSYVYRKGLQDFNWGLSTAVGLFNNVVNVICLVAVNQIAGKVGETSLW